MKARYTFTTLICAILFLGSCQDDPLFNAPGKGIRITASLAPDTRIAYTEGESSIRCTWETGDAIGLSTANQANLKYQAVAGGETANFNAATSNDILTAGDGETIYAYYPYSTENEQYEVEGEDYATVALPSISWQYRSEGLSKYDFVYATGKLTDNTCVLPFKHLFTYLKVDIDTRELQEPQESWEQKGIRIESTEPLTYIIQYMNGTHPAKFNLETQQILTEGYKDAESIYPHNEIYYVTDEENATNDSIITCYIAMLPQPEGAVISIRDANAYENQIYDDRHVPKGGLQSGRMYSLGLSDTINAVVNTTYDLYIAWEILGIVKNENGIFYNPDLSSPADWYEASYTPISQRIETYEDGSRRGSTWNDYGKLSSPAGFTEAHFIENENTTQYANLPSYNIFRSNERVPQDKFEGNNMSKIWYGEAREVFGLDFYNVTTTEDKHVYCYYDNGERNESHTPFTEDYGKCTLTGPSRIYLTEEQVQKLNAYFGHEITYGELIQIPAEELIRILGTGHLENPYLGLPEGAYSFAYNEETILALDGVKTWDLDFTENLAYGIEFTYSDGFFVLSDKDSIMMQTYPRNIGKPEYKVEMEILSDDAEKTVGVLKMTASQFFQYENTLNGFPDIVNIVVDEWGIAYEGINYDDYHSSFHFSEVHYDTLVTYKYAEDVPFKVRNHYYYCGQNSMMGGMIPIEISPEYVDWEDSVYTHAGRVPELEWEIIPESDWIIIDPRNFNDYSLVLQHEEGFPYIRCEFAATQNDNREYRIGYITIGIKGSDHKERVRVVQHGGDLAIGNSETYHFDYTGGTFYATGQTNHGTDELWPSIDVDWVHLGAETRGMSDFQFGPFYVDENTSTQPRETMFRIYDGNGEICKITVTQDGCPAELSKAVRSSRRPESKKIHPQYRKARTSLQKDVIVVPYR